MFGVARSPAYGERVVAEQCIATAASTTLSEPRLKVLGAKYRLLIVLSLQKAVDLCVRLALVSMVEDDLAIFPRGWIAPSVAEVRATMMACHA